MLGTTARGDSPMDRPQTVEQVLKWVEEGRIPLAKAFNYLVELEKTGGPGIQAPGNGRAAVTCEGTGAAHAARAAQLTRAARVEEAMQELEVLIGLDGVKRLVRELYAFVEIQRRRAQHFLATEPLVLHMIFKGKPLNTPVKLPTRYYKVNKSLASLTSRIFLSLTITLSRIVRNAFWTTGNSP